MAQGTTHGVPIDTDPTLSSNSDQLVPSEKAVKTYIDARSGYSGYSGYSGISGYSGSGISGYSGYSGQVGATGTGTSGYSGISGYSGYSGPLYSIPVQPTAPGTFTGELWLDTSATSSLTGSGYSGYSGSGISGYSGFSGPGGSTPAVTNDTTNASYYPIWVKATGGGQAIYASSGYFNLNPSNGKVSFGNAIDPFLASAATFYCTAGTQIGLGTTDLSVLGGTGSFINLALNASSGNTTGAIQVFNSGNTTYNNLFIQPLGGNVSIGTLGNIYAKLEVSGSVRVQGASSITNGAGLELVYAGPTSYITSVDRTSGASYGPIVVTNSTFAVWTGTTGATTQQLGITGSGVAIGGTCTPVAAGLTVSLNAVTPQVSSPTFALQVATATGSNNGILIDAYAASPVLRFRRGDTSATSPSAVQLNENIGGFQGYGFGTTVYSGNAAGFNMIAAENFTDSANGTYIAIYTTPKTTTTITQRMLIDSTGNVLIGTAGQYPDSVLTLASSANALPAPAAGTMFHLAAADGVQTRMYLDCFNNGTGTIAANIIGRAAEGTTASPTALLANDFMLSLSGFGATGAATYSAAAGVQIRMIAAENWSTSNNGTYMTFYTTPKLSTVASIAERVRIDSTGYFGINTVNTTGPATLFSIGGDANGGQAGIHTATELLTVAAATTSATVGNLLPAKAMVLAVSCRVTTVIPTATSFTLKSTTDSVVFTGAVSVAANSTDPGTTHWAATTSKLSTAAQTITLTITGSTPANNTGRVRITVYYWLPTPPTS